MRVFVLIYFERLRSLLLDMNQKKFWGKITIEIDFKDGGITDAYVSAKEKIVLPASR